MKSINQKFSLLAVIIAVLVISGCNKKFDAKPTYRARSLAGTWAKQEPLYFPKASVYVDTTNSWKPFFGYSFTTEAEPNVLGFSNPYVYIGKGTNALGMNSIYYNYAPISSNNFTYNVVIPKCFEFVPDAPTSNVGNVNVIPQKVTLTKTAEFNFEKFYVPIRPTDKPGRFNLETKEFEVEVEFDDTAVGGPLAVRRKYKFKQ